MAKIGHYEILGELGRGAMGVVFRGFDPAIGRPVAIKVIKAQAFSTLEEIQEARLRFAREAAAAGKLSHPNIVTVYHLGEESDYQYLAMELVEGKPLAPPASGGETATPTSCLPLLRQVAAALDYAHARGVFHRDIKPANILVDAEGQVKITDFRIARIATQTMTKTGVTMGTPAYMAPEQVPAARVDGKADQFSLAVVAFELLTGGRPFQADTDHAVMFAIVSGERPTAHQVNPALPPTISDVLRCALAKEKAERYAGCAAFVSALDAAFVPPATRAVFADGLSPVPPPPGLPGAAPQPAAPSPPPEAPAAEPPNVTRRLVPRPGTPSLSSEAPAPGAVKINPEDGLNYVWIPPGTFTMGCSAEDSECYENEKPARQVTITKGFWIGQTAVTQRAYRRVTGRNPSRFKGDDLPVESVSWDEAKRFCEKVGMRLPTEAEWEYAARAGSCDARPDDIDEILWSYSNSGLTTHPVRQKLANVFGLYDMLGNVWEWVEDWYESYQGGEQRDPRGPGSGHFRVVRGGSAINMDRYARVSGRFNYEPLFRDSTIGLRCAGEIP